MSISMRASRGHILFTTLPRDTTISIRLFVNSLRPFPRPHWRKLAGQLWRSWRADIYLANGEESRVRFRRLRTRSGVSLSWNIIQISPNHFLKQRGHMGMADLAAELFRANRDSAA